MLSPELSDLMNRITAIENRKPEPAVTQTSSPFSIVFLPQQVALASETLTADKDWTDAGLNAHIPRNARYALVSPFIRDTVDGVGYSYIKHRGGGSELTLSKMYEGSSNAQETNEGQVIVPLSQGTFEYSVTLPGGATSLTYELDLQGYIL